MNDLKAYIETCFDSDPKSLNKHDVLEKTDKIIHLLNDGIIRVAEKINGSWTVNSWIKKAILLMFRFKDAQEQIFDSFDKLGLLDFDQKTPRYRKVPGSLIRNGVYIGNNVVLMPSYINIGAYISDGTMIDMNATIGSCAQIGKKCHISALVCIGGVLEPAVATPVIIEDNCFIGAGSCISEGVIVEEGSVIASGVSISGSTKIIDRETKTIYKGIVPRGSVIISGSYPSDGLNISCAIIAKKVDAKTKEKSSINEILRECP